MNDLDILGQLIAMFGNLLVTALGNSPLHDIARMASDPDGVTEFFDYWAGHLIGQLGIFTRQHLLNASAVRAGRVLIQIGVWLKVGYEMWPVIMGKKTPDILIFVKPMVILVILNYWVVFCTALMAPGEELAEGGQAFYQEHWSKISASEDSVRVLQGKLEALRDTLAKKAYEEKIATEEAAKEESEDPGALEDISEDDEKWYEKVGSAISEKLSGLFDSVTTKLDALRELVAEKFENFFKSLIAKFFGLIEKIVKWISCLYLQMNFYGIMMVGQLGMGILALFGPIIFALSVFEVWSDNWAKWMMQFLTFSLYGFLCWVAMGYTYAILLYELDKEKEVLRDIINRADLSRDSVRDVLSSNFGILVNYLVALWTGGYCMRFVPEIAAMVFGSQTSSSAASAAGALKSGMKSTINLVK